MQQSHFVLKLSMHCPWVDLMRARLYFKGNQGPQKAHVDFMYMSNGFFEY